MQSELIIPYLEGTVSTIEPLHDLIDLTYVIIDEGINPSLPQEGENTLLSLLLSHAHQVPLHVLAELLAIGARGSIVPFIRSTPGPNDDAIVELLSLHIDQLDGAGEALFYPDASSTPTRIQILLDMYVSPESLFAVSVAHANTIDDLLRLQANGVVLSTQGPEDYNILFQTNRPQQLEAVEYLLRNRYLIADIVNDQDDETPLFQSIRVNDLPRAQLLLAYGADPNHRNEDGETPLAIAIEWGRRDGAKLLLEAGADPNVDGGVLLTHPHLDKAMLKLLLDAGAQVPATFNPANPEVARWWNSRRVKQSILRALEPHHVQDLAPIVYSMLEEEKWTPWYPA